MFLIKKNVFTTYVYATLFFLTFSSSAFAWGWGWVHDTPASARVKNLSSQEIIVKTLIESETVAPNYNYYSIKSPESFISKDVFSPSITVLTTDNRPICSLTAKIPLNSSNTQIQITNDHPERCFEEYTRDNRNIVYFTVYVYPALY